MIKDEDLEWVDSWRIVEILQYKHIYVITNNKRQSSIVHLKKNHIWQFDIVIGHYYQ